LLLRRRGPATQQSISDQEDGTDPAEAALVRRDLADAVAGLTATLLHGARD